MYCSGENIIDATSYISNEIDILLNSYSSIDVIKKVPCLCSFCTKNDKKFLFNVDFLRDALSHGENLVRCQFSFERVEVSKLLSLNLSKEKDNKINDINIEDSNKKVEKNLIMNGTIIIIYILIFHMKVVEMIYLFKCSKI